MLKAQIHTLEMRPIVKYQYVIFPLPLDIAYPEGKNGATFFKTR
ncbi:hypothetical protein ACFQU5_14180 [Ureibacillus sp. GCM10028918]